MRVLNYCNNYLLILRTNMKKFLTLIALPVMMFAPQAMAQKLTANNIDEIVKAMTLEEKAQLLVGARNEDFSGNGATIGATKVLVPGAAGTTQHINRLGIPSTVLSDGPAGVRISPTRPNDKNTYYATGFPVGTSLASSWNTALVTNVGKAIGNEVLEYGCDVLLAPGMNIHRNPLCGRNFEYYSEDPVLAGKIAAAYVNGIQSNGVGTSVKHFAANSQETNRMGDDAIISQRALREIYLKNFEIVVKEAKPWTIMSSYNKINGTFTQESRDLLTDILRNEWGYKGIVMTDWTGQRNTAAQVHAGNDLMEPGMPQQSEEIVRKVKSGELSESDVDICVKRILEYIVKTPRFKGYQYSNKPDLKAHAAITRQSATEGMVLLKNDNSALPLNKGISNIALFGNTSYGFIAGGTGSGDVNKAYVVDLKQGLENAGYKLDNELNDLYTKYNAYEFSRKYIEVPAQYRMWFHNIKAPEMNLSKRVIDQQASKADAAIITIGRNAGEGNDRKVTGDFNIDDNERAMLNDVCNAFHAAGKPVIVIMNIGGVIETASWKDLPDAILLAWQPGQEGGNSIADVLTGKAYPSGKLTSTFPISYTDVPSAANFPNADKQKSWFDGEEQKGNVRNVDYTLYNEDIYVGYRYFKTAGKKVSYPFGFGLGYTTFAYSGAKVSAAKDGFTAYVTVKNTGDAAGKEVVELYVCAPKGGLNKPACELKSFAKTRELKPGESQTLQMKVDNYDLASFNESHSAWEAAKGNYRIMFGASVNDIRATANYTLSKESTFKANNVLKPTKQLDILTLNK